MIAATSSLSPRTAPANLKDIETATADNAAFAREAYEAAATGGVEDLQKAAAELKSAFRDRVAGLQAPESGTATEALARDLDARGVPAPEGSGDASEAVWQMMETELKRASLEATGYGLLCGALDAAILLGARSVPTELKVSPEAAAAARTLLAEQAKDGPVKLDAPSDNTPFSADLVGGCINGYTDNVKGKADVLKKAGAEVCQGQVEEMVGVYTMMSDLDKFAVGGGLTLHDYQESQLRYFEEAYKAGAAQSALARMER